jgi:DNA-binding GntR family transcriptional regulator
MRQLGLELGVELVELGPVTPPPEVAERPGLKAEEKALIRRGQMYAGGQPMQLATSYVPWSFAEGMQMVERDSGPTLPPRRLWRELGDLARARELAVRAVELAGRLDPAAASPGEHAAGCWRAAAWPLLSPGR